MNPIFDVIIPTWNNPDFLNPCLDSIIACANATQNGGRVIIVNNGQQPIEKYVGDTPNILVLNPKENLGWERGLEYGLKYSTAPFVVFQNDDTHIPRSNFDFYQQLLRPFSDTRVAAVGPITTVASGYHSIFRKDALMSISEVPFLIFFTVMVRRSDLDAAGGIDVSAPGGDDLDLSIRFRNVGKKLLINPSAFIIHHAFKTGERVRGGPDTSGGWNSIEMRDRTNRWIIQKHGFKKFIDLSGSAIAYSAGSGPVDSEGDVIREIVQDSMSVLELGCGAQKTVPHAIGVDRIPKGEMVTHIGKPSVADIVADVSKDIPLPSEDFDFIISRHILEHCIDVVSVLKEWKRLLRENGKIIIAVPNEGIINGVPMNPEHVHAFTIESLKSLVEACGLREVQVIDPKNGVSFVGVYEKGTANA
ncbi:MAG TPA: glycosyltransferase [Candidatus Hydrogenedentes bacterium]|nr:glycosyltransferase [Candidatus Hydrogenedentota bacterium]